MKKICSKCNISKNASEFHKRSNRKSGICSCCKLCTKKYHQANKTVWAKQTKKRKTDLLSRGLCVDCGKSKLATHSKNQCPTCYWKHRSCHALGVVKHWEFVRDVFYANPVCPYSGEKLVLGVNAELDHKIPRVVRPDLVSDINNVHWVSTEMNKKKKNRTHSEFKKYLASELSLASLEE